MSAFKDQKNEVVIQVRGGNGNTERSGKNNTMKSDFSSKLLSAKDCICTAIF